MRQRKPQRHEKAHVQRRNRLDAARLYRAQKLREQTQHGGKKRKTQAIGVKHTEVDEQHGERRKRCRNNAHAEQSRNAGAHRGTHQIHDRQRPDHCPHQHAHKVCGGGYAYARYLVNNRGNTVPNGGIEGRCFPARGHICDGQRGSIARICHIANGVEVKVYVIGLRNVFGASDSAGNADVQQDKADENAKPRRKSLRGKPARTHNCGVFLLIAPFLWGGKIQPASTAKQTADQIPQTGENNRESERNQE